MNMSLADTHANISQTARQANWPKDLEIIIYNTTIRTKQSLEKNTHTNNAQTYLMISLEDSSTDF